ncbi:MAG: ABC transporter substrate-binding protein [Sphingomonadaceae bacterium]|nr:ABC transporter substrate-binding protein [Sphingomonadaceae bacterium]MCP5390846.1 ABC transporter substrate-binding protein [Sphingomonadaceae bacterium]
MGRKDGWEDQTRLGSTCFWLAGLALLLGACAGTASADGTIPERLTIYSPAPPKVILYEYNQQLADALDSCPGVPTAAISAVALPDSINEIGEVTATQKSGELPIITPLHLRSAIAGAGPEWHSFVRPNPDLKFLSSLYDVGVGIYAFSPDVRTPQDLIGKRIAAEPRPGAVRLYTELLLRDGWGILDQVELVHVGPAELPDAIAEGRVDAVSWNLLLRSPQGYRPWFPSLAVNQPGGWIPVGQDAVNRINIANDLSVGRVRVSTYDLGESGVVGLDDPVALLSFKQGLAGWESTDDALVTAVLTCIEQHGRLVAGLPDDAASMANWDGLRADEVHPAALRFYSAHMVEIGGAAHD